MQTSQCLLLKIAIKRITEQGFSSCGMFRDAYANILRGTNSPPLYPIHMLYYLRRSNKGSAKYLFFLTGIQCLKIILRTTELEHNLQRFLFLFWSKIVKNYTVFVTYLKALLRVINFTLKQLNFITFIFQMFKSLLEADEGG